MSGTSGARSAAREAREPAAAEHGAWEHAAGLVRPGGGTILDAIGNTPLIMVDGIWVKLEYLNPSGSIKARIARYMIERAEREGLLRPGDTIVEASSGNTGNAMSMVAAVRGYRMLVVMPNGMSGERLAISRAFGAQVMTLGDFHVNDALAKVRELGRQPGYFAPQQFDSEWNVEENRTWLGPETLAQLPDGVVPDAVVGGVGTGGTIVGVGQCFRERNSSCKVVAVEPNESCLLMRGEVGRHLIEGISDGFVPGIFARHRHIIDEIVAVDSDAAISEMRRLAREFGRAPARRPRAASTVPRPPARRHVLLRRGREVHQRLLPQPPIRWLMPGTSLVDWASLAGAIGPHLAGHTRRHRRAGQQLRHAGVRPVRGGRRTIRSGHRGAGIGVHEGSSAPLIHCGADGRDRVSLPARDPVWPVRS